MSDDVITFPKRSDAEFSGEGDTPAEVVRRSDIRRRTGGGRLTVEVAAKLSKLSALVAKRNVRKPGTGKDERAAANVTGAVVVLLTDEAPVFTYAGAIEWPDIEVAYEALRAVWWSRHHHKRDDEGWSYRDHVAAEWARDQAHKARAEEKQREEADARPWQCEWCDRRYMHKGRAERHERECWRNPQAERYTSGAYAPHFDGQGRVNGFTMLQDPAEAAERELRKARLACPDCRAFPCWRHVEPAEYRRREGT